MTGERPVALIVRAEVASYIHIALDPPVGPLTVTVMHRGRVGYYLQAIHDDKDAAESLGVSAQLLGSSRRPVAIAVQRR